jgi:hypothetical protein
LTLDRGQWESFPTNLSYSYSWFRCETAQTSNSETIPTGCTRITLNASSQSYRLVDADLGTHVVARVTANLPTTIVGVSSSSQSFTTSQGIIIEPQAQPLRSLRLTSGANFLEMTML